MVSRVIPRSARSTRKRPAGSSVPDNSAHSPQNSDPEDAYLDHPQDHDISEDFAEDDALQEQTDESDDGDDDYSTQNPPARGGARRRKKQRRQDAGGGADADQFEENALFLALSSRDVAVADLALEWIDSFTEDDANAPTEAITALFNLVLRCCGCTHLAQAHDMVNDDSASATVAEIAILFTAQPSHEYPFVSTNKATKHFRGNVEQFFRSLVSAGHEKGSLYKPRADEQTSSLGSPMMNTVLAWLSALSSCNVRPFRFVSTVLLLDMQTQLCDVASATTIALQKHQRQLNNARNNTTARNSRVQKNKMAIISENVDSCTLHKNTLHEYIGDIFSHVYVNRYRDVDPHIRSECLRALAQWMVHYEEMFLRADYLRYLGWLLSDPTDSVKLDAVKSLLKLYKFINGKREAMSIGFRQFTETFKSQFINMAWKERLSGVRVHLLEILSELFFLGFLEDSDVQEICSLGFFLAESDATPNADTRAKIEVCKFMAVVCEEQARTDVEPFKSFLETHESSRFDQEEHALGVEQCLKYKALADLMESSNAHYHSTERELIRTGDDSRKPMFMLIDSLFRVIYSLPAFSGQWEGLIKYTLCDFSSITFTPKETAGTTSPEEEDLAAELVSKLEVSSSAQKHVFLSFIAAAIIHILTKEPPKKTTPTSKFDDINVVLPILVKYISSLEEYSSSAMSLYTVFMSIWNSILITVPTTIARLYSNVADISDYNAIHDKVLHYYFDMTSPDADLSESFDTYFSLILKNYESSNSADIATKTDRLLNASIKMQIEDLLHSLAAEGVDALFSAEPIVDTNDSEENSVLSVDQKAVINKLLRVTPILQKFSQIARVINISRYVAEATFGTSNVLLEALQTNLVSKFDFRTLIRVWPSNYAAIMSQLSDSWQCVLEFILLALSWKLEDLTYASGDNSAQSIDINLFLDDFNGLLLSTGDLCVEVGTSARNLNEITPDSNTKMRSLVQNLVSLEHTFACHYIDMLVSMRTFYDKFHRGENFKNFSLFFENDAGIGALVKGQLPEVIQQSLIRVFLIHESRLALLKNTPLDRQNNEDVNYDDFVFDDDHQSMSTKREDINSNIFEDVPTTEVQPNAPNPQNEHRVWVSERTLCVYTLKLFSLIHSGAFASDAVSRIQLNSKKLNNLFQKIVELGMSQCAFTDDDLQV
ncbi:hypothetical protein JCM33374_g2203 [Metschnikowia sp. JCM 33374]|nr:hypothetical protein JCM33374_g2203 [Metschnikowia sp. JCM 33374]